MAQYTKTTYGQSKSYLTEGQMIADITGWESPAIPIPDHVDRKFRTHGSDGVARLLINAAQSGKLSEFVANANSSNKIIGCGTCFDADSQGMPKYPMHWSHGHKSEPTITCTNPECKAVYTFESK